MIMLSNAKILQQMVLRTVGLSHAYQIYKIHRITEVLRLNKLVFIEYLVIIITLVNRHNYVNINI